MARSAEDIKKDVVDQLYWDSRVDASEVSVEVHDGKVMLRGSVPTLVARHFAAADALAVAGNYGIENQLTVRYPSTVVAPSDEQVRNNVERVLEWNSEVDAEHIRVQVRQGVVTLEGSVDALWKQPYVEDLISRLTGVTAIDNKLTTVPTKDVSDEIIAESVIEALNRNPAINADAVEVTVANAVVRLAGAVRDRRAREIAHHTAMQAFGAVAVDNQLMVAEEAGR